MEWAGPVPRKSPVNWKVVHCAHGFLLGQQVDSRLLICACWAFPAWRQGRVASALGTHPGIGGSSSMAE